MSFIQGVLNVIPIHFGTYTYILYLEVFLFQECPFSEVLLCVHSYGQILQFNQATLLWQVAFQKVMLKDSQSLILISIEFHSSLI